MCNRKVIILMFYCVLFEWVIRGIAGEGGVTLKQLKGDYEKNVLYLAIQP